MGSFHLLPEQPPRDMLLTCTAVSARVCICYTWTSFARTAVHSTC